MAFHKTSIAITTRTVSPEDAVTLTQEDQLPAHPAEGDVHEGLVWDGGAWIPVEVWTARRAADQPPAEA